MYLTRTKLTKLIHEALKDFFDAQETGDWSQYDKKQPNTTQKKTDVVSAEDPLGFYPKQKTRSSKRPKFTEDDAWNILERLYKKMVGEALQDAKDTKDDEDLHWTDLMIEPGTNEILEGFFDLDNDIYDYLDELVDKYVKKWANEGRINKNLYDRNRNLRPSKYDKYFKLPR
tara:strand:+ start:4401 stop:4916 length:516 start_codon:yes stop_codon:yes gene_type:complete